MDGSTRLGVPDLSMPGPSQTSRQGSRPVSANVYPSSASPSGHSQSATSASRKQRASHTVTSQQPVEEQPIYRDVYSHHAAVAYAAAHPRRTIPKFGPYLLLQTLGEGEFGKVKLGLHGQWGEEVAVKLIRRGNIDTAVRQSKVEREIEVLRTIKHPNIVRLYDVIETDKYIGIILEYASGGELFDHILAHRYLKEKDACKLFTQLISGVWYIHQKKIVHRDLKLENLLLDRNRNVIITDFGFANRFEHRSDDLMQTSCGSPCYAAPELVISEGLYVGSAVDIWSCGVILYAMLAGYLPFDDDPANPDGDNINLLYKYIVNTPLTFPDYISVEARDLLSMMLVPDPLRRADLPAIMAHTWLRPYSYLFDRTVQDLEKAAMEQHQLKRLAYQRQMKHQAAAAATSDKVQRSHSARTDVAQSASVVRTRQPPSAQSPVFLYDNAADGTSYVAPGSAQPNPNRRQAVSAVVMPSAASPMDDDPFALSPTNPPTVSAAPSNPSAPAEHAINGNGSADAHKSKESTPRTGSTRKAPPVIAPIKASPEKRKADRQRHTIQVEYGGDEEESKTSARSPAKVSQASVRQPLMQQDMEVDDDRVYISEPFNPNGSPVRHSTLPSQQSPRYGGFSPDGPTTPKSSKPLPSPPIPSPNATPKRSPSVPTVHSHHTARSESTPPKSYRSPEAPTVSVSPSSPVHPSNHASPPTSINENGVTEQGGPGSTGSAGSGSSKGKHRKGMSVDKFVGKLWGNGSETGSGVLTNRSPSRMSSNGSAATHPNVSPTSTKTVNEPAPGKRPSKSRIMSSLISSSKAVPMSTAKSTDSKEKKKRRSTLTVMVEPFSRQLKSRSKDRSASGDATPVSKDKEDIPSPSPFVRPAAVKHVIQTPVTPRFQDVPRPVGGMGVPASTNKASKVMQWFRYKSKGRSGSESVDEFESIPHPERDVQETDRSTTPTMASYKEKSNTGLMSSSDTISRPRPAPILQPPTTVKTPRATSMSRPSASESSTAPVRITNRALHALSTGFSAVTAAPSRATAQSSFNKTAMRLHHGAVDQTTVTTVSPPDVMALVAKVLVDMGLEVQQETDFKYRCVRPKRKKPLGSTSTGALTAFTMVGSAASNGVDKRGLPVPSGTSMLRGLLMRRQSSQVSASGAQPSSPYDSDANPDASMNSSFTKDVAAPLPSTTSEVVYGDAASDQGGEVRFSVELTRIDGLEDTFSLEIRRLKGNLVSYKFLYDIVRNRCDLQR